MPTSWVLEITSIAFQNYTGSSGHTQSAPVAALLHSMSASWVPEISLTTSQVFAIMVKIIIGLGLLS